MSNQSIMSLNSAVSAVDQGNPLLKLVPQMNEVLDLLNSDERSMIVSSGEVQDLSIQTLVCRRKSVISGMRDLLEKLDIPDLSELDIDPTYTQASLLEKLTKELAELEICYNHGKNDIRNMSTSLKSYKLREQHLKEVVDGVVSLENDNDNEPRSAAVYQEMFTKIKRDLDTVLTTFCPQFKDEIKKFLSVLEQAEKSDKEIDHWKQPDDNMDMGAIMILLKAKIIIQHPIKKTLFKLASLY